MTVNNTCVNFSALHARLSPHHALITHTRMGGCDSKEKEELVDVEDDEYYKEVSRPVPCLMRMPAGALTHCRVLPRRIFAKARPRGFCRRPASIPDLVQAKVSSSKVRVCSLYETACQCSGLLQRQLTLLATILSRRRAATQILERNAGICDHDAFHTTFPCIIQLLKGSYAPYPHTFSGNAYTD